MIRNSVCGENSVLKKWAVAHSIAVELSANPTIVWEQKGGREIVGNCPSIIPGIIFPRTLRFLPIIIDPSVYWGNLGVNTDGTHRDFISARDRTVFGRTHASPEPETRRQKFEHQNWNIFRFIGKRIKTCTARCVVAAVVAFRITRCK